MPERDDVVVQAFTRRSGDSWFLDRDVVQHRLAVPRRAGILMRPGPEMTACREVVLGFEEGWLDTALPDSRNCPRCMAAEIDAKLQQLTRTVGQEVKPLVAARGHWWRLLLVEVADGRSFEFAPMQEADAAGQSRRGSGWLMRAWLEYDSPCPGQSPRHVKGDRQEWLLSREDLLSLWREVVRRPEVGGSPELLVIEFGGPKEEEANDAVESD